MGRELTFGLRIETVVNIEAYIIYKLLYEIYEFNDLGIHCTKKTVYIPNPFHKSLSIYIRL